MGAPESNPLHLLTALDKNIVVAYAESNMNCRKTARVLNYSYNGIAYHLVSTRTKTGLDPYQFRDLAQLVSIIDAERRDFDKNLYTG